VRQSNAESKYYAIANVTCKLFWVRDLLIELGFAPECSMMLYYDNQATIHIAENSVFHKRTKHVEVDCHLVSQKVEDKIIQAPHISSNH